MESRDDLLAARVTGPLWAAISAAGGPRPATRQHAHYPAAYDADWLATLPLPVGEHRPAGQPVALLDGQNIFERTADGPALAAAYSRHPRSQVYEDIGLDWADAWYALTARHLGRLASSGLQVACSIFASRSQDESLRAHWDTWYGAIVQIDGAKIWEIGDSLLNGSNQAARQTITRAGDILLLPKGLPHAVSTPTDPGHSVHLAFAIDRDPG
jgi:hypothetical protein